MKSAARLLSLMLLAMLGTVLLMRFAPGYYTDARELDAQSAQRARGELSAQAGREGSATQFVVRILRGWLHGDIGQSRQYDVPVRDLIAERAALTVKLLLESIACAWAVALAAALLTGLRRVGRGEALIALPAALLLAIPVGALAMLCMVSDFGGPLLVLSALIAVRDFKLVYRLLRETRRSPHLLYARAQGLSSRRIVFAQIMPKLRTQMLALATMSLVVALSALVPVEVIFDAPGLGQLAWSAAMNRDLPVLLAVTVLMALCIGCAGLMADSGRAREASQCA